MPYTPPAVRTPASPTAVSPQSSRRPSTQTGSRPSLPRSASYLTRQPRRTNSRSERDAELTATTNTLLNTSPKSPRALPPSDIRTTPPGTCEDLQSLISNGVVRQSPPLVSEVGSMPKGAIISPPDSSTSSSDESDEVARGRLLERQVKDKLEEAIGNVTQQQLVSPPRNYPLEDTVNTSGMYHSFSSISLADAKPGPSRRILHGKSNTLPNIEIPRNLAGSVSDFGEDSDEDMNKKPAMVRKKSGELVRPALRASSRKRPSSMPGTPTFSKNVHFDSCLEQVRHFHNVDRPSAVSVGSSPVETYDTEDEFPFEPAGRPPPFEWELGRSNFPLETNASKTQPVRMERVWLSSDQKSLMGSVVVANLAFHKVVVCRFTMDYWKTTSEVAADYSQEVHPRVGPIGHDRFTFSIKLSDTAKLESKTLYFCIRYGVNGQEFWDSNNHANFKVDFKKKMMPQNGKRGFTSTSVRGANSHPLPRSSRRSAAGTSGKLSTAGDGKKFSSHDPDRKLVEDVLGDPGSLAGLRLKGVKSASSLASDNLPAGLASPNGQAFSNRYDFGASLSAAKQAGKGISNSNTESDADGLYMKPNRRGEAASMPKAQPVPRLRPHPKAQPQPSANTSNGGSAIASESYEEILNKYCFFGSKQVGLDGPRGSGAVELSPKSRREGQQAEGKEPSEKARGSRGAQVHNSATVVYGEECGRVRPSTAQHHSLYNPLSPPFFYSAPQGLTTTASQLDNRSSSPTCLGSAFAPRGGTSSPEFHQHGPIPAMHLLNTECFSATASIGG